MEMEATFGNELKFENEIELNTIVTDFVIEKSN